MAKGNITIPIPGELESAASEQIVSSAYGIYDYNKGKRQEDVNKETDESLTSLSSKIDSSVNTEKVRAEAAEKALSDRVSDVEQLEQISISGGEAEIATGEDFNNPTAEQRVKIATVGSILDGADDEPTAGSEALVKSGGMYSIIGTEKVTDEVDVSVIAHVNNSLRVYISLKKGDILSVKLIDPNNTCLRVNLNLFVGEERAYQSGYLPDIVNNFFSITIPFDITSFTINSHSDYITGNEGNVAIAYKTGLEVKLENANKNIENNRENIEKLNSNSKEISNSIYREQYLTTGYKQNIILTPERSVYGNLVIPIDIKQGEHFKIKLDTTDGSTISSVAAYYESSESYTACDKDIYNNYIASENITAITPYIINITEEQQAIIEIINDNSIEDRITILENGNYWKSEDYLATTNTAIDRNKTKLQYSFRNNSNIKVKVNDISKTLINIRIVLFDDSNNIYKTYISTSFLNNYAVIPISLNTSAIAILANSGEVIGDGIINYEIILDVIEENSKEEIHTNDILFLRDSVYDLSGSTVGDPITDSSRVGCKVEVSAGDLIIINGKNLSGSRRLWAFIDSENNIISVADPTLYQYCAVNLRLIAPANSAYIIVQFLRNAANLEDFSVDIYKSGTIAKERALQTKDPLPSYYFENNYILNKVDRINELYKKCADTGDCFAFISDQHWDDKQLLSKRSPALLHYIEENTKINKVLDGGDIATRGVNYATLEYLDCMKRNLSIPFYFSVGNHDGTDDKLLAWCYNLKNVKGNLSKNYYYVDEPNKKIRYVSLNVFSADNLDEEQREWVFNEALNVEEGWGIIIYSHMFIGVDLATDVATLREHSADFVERLEDYNNDPNSKGEIIALLQGHVHRDRIYYTEKANIPIIVTTCDKYVIYYSTGNVPDTNVDRIPGTITENAFDIVVLNREERKLYFVRIGAKAKDGIGNDPGDEVEERVISY